MALSRYMKRKWIAALRSGKYRRGKHALRVVENGRASYCCLGVLGQVKGVKWKKGFLDTSCTSRCSKFYPTVNGSNVGIDDGFGFLRPKFAGISKDKQDKLAEMNDGITLLMMKNGKFKRHTFKTIADWIQKNL